MPSKRYCRSGNVSGDLLAVLAMTMVMAAPALAFPEGAPWGAANPDSGENCGTCHFGYDATLEAKALSVKGLPETAVPGTTYELEISFDDAEAAVAGFASVLAKILLRDSCYSCRSEE